MGIDLSDFYKRYNGCEKLKAIANAIIHYFQMRAAENGTFCWHQSSTTRNITNAVLSRTPT